MRMVIRTSWYGIVPLDKGSRYAQGSACRCAHRYASSPNRLRWKGLGGWTQPRDAPGIFIFCPCWRVEADILARKSCVDNHLGQIFIILCVEHPPLLTTAVRWGAPLSHGVIWVSMT